MTSEEATRELLELSQLTKHPGYLRFVAFAQKEWTEQISQHLETSVNDPNDVMAVNKMRQVIAAKKAVDRLLAWPGERIAQLERHKAAGIPTGSQNRGGQ